MKKGEIVVNIIKKLEKEHGNVKNITLNMVYQEMFLDNETANVSPSLISFALNFIQLYNTK